MTKEDALRMARYKANEQQVDFVVFKGLNGQFNYALHSYFLKELKPANCEGVALCRPEFRKPAYDEELNCSGKSKNSSRQVSTSSGRRAGSQNL